MNSLQCQLEDVQHMVRKMQSESKGRDVVLQAFCEATRQSSYIETQNMRDLTNQLSCLAMKVRTTESNQMLLQSLRFNNIRSRETQIVPAHAETLKWLLDPSSPSTLAKWLESQSGIYWINGKPGSGKSTLMKYLVAHPQTAELLKKWAGTQTLVTASVYFWHAGTVLQKSQEGLLRSLLFEILRQSPDLIQVVCASKLAAFRPFEPKIEPWTDLELRQAIDLLKGETRMNARFCFFIDGLDEYDGHPDDIIDVLQSLCSLPDIKLCVSSRPWNEFSDAFGQDPDSRLALEDLTREDIKIYVKQTLENNHNFANLKQEDGRSQDLVQEIVDKARGVFLWVVLVTRSLLNGVRNADRICDLQRRLRDFPATLEKYFSHMYSSIEETYRELTAQTFKFILAASIGEYSRRLPLILFSFLDEEDLDAVVENSCSNPLSEREIISRQDVMRRRLAARCKGLVEIVDANNHPPFEEDRYGKKLLDPRVDFIHRTAYDFLATKDMQHQLSSNLKPDFEEDILICKAYAALLKSIDYSSAKAPASYLHTLIHGLAQHAGLVETKSGFSPITLLDKTRSVVKEHEECFSNRDGTGGDVLFLQEIIKYGSYYITEVLNRGCHQISRGKINKLMDALTICSGRISPTASQLSTNLKTLDLLLEHGGSPSQAWECIFRNFGWQHHPSDHVIDILVPYLKKLLQHGADPQHGVAPEEATSEKICETPISPEDLINRTQIKSGLFRIADVFSREKARGIFSTRQIEDYIGPAPERSRMLFLPTRH